MQTSMVMFNLSILDWKYLFWGNLVQQIKIFGLICDLLYKLEYPELDGYFRFFSFSSKITFFDKYAISFRNFFFFGKIFRIRLIQICGIRWCSFVLCFGSEILFWKKFIPNYQDFYKFLFKLFNLMMSCFCFEKEIKIPANVSLLPSFLLRSNTE